MLGRARMCWAGCIAIPALVHGLVVHRQRWGKRGARSSAPQPAHDTSAASKDTLSPCNFAVVTE